MARKRNLVNHKLRVLINNAISKNVEILSADDFVQIEKEYNCFLQYGHLQKIIDIINLKSFANKEDILIFSRGAMNGSLTLYLLGVTDINPKKYGLIFDRWNLSRLPFDFSISKNCVPMVKKWLQQNTRGYEKEELFFEERENVETLQNCVDLMKKKGIDFSFRANYDDKEVWDVIINEYNQNSFFFIDKAGNDILKKATPNNIIEYATFLCPIKLQSNCANTYFEGREIDSQISFCENILRETKGHLFYQEQLIRILHEIVGYPYDVACWIYKMMNEKFYNKIPEQEEKALTKILTCDLVEECIKNGYEKNVAESIKKDINNISRPLFMKAHFLTIAMIDYRLAYLKRYYPKELAASAKN